MPLGNRTRPEAVAPSLTHHLTAVAPPEAGCAGCAGCTGCIGGDCHSL